MDFVELTFAGLKMFPVLWGIGVLVRFITAPSGFIHISLLYSMQEKSILKNIGSLWLGVNSYLGGVISTFQLKGFPTRLKMRYEKSV
jgi:hypothetical protein